MKRIGIKNLKSKIKNCILVGVLVMAGSCNDWLNLTPYDGVMEDNYWRTKEDVHKFAIGCYSSLLNNELIDRIIIWGEMRADMVTPGPNANSNHVNVMRGEISPDNGLLTWSKFYFTIKQCNKLIEKSALTRQYDGTFTEPLYRQYVAEAKIIRSLMYFYLVRSFKDVPFELKATDSDDQQYFYPAKTEGDVILDSLAVHVMDAIKYLPEKYATNEQSKGRFTRYGAMALLADIFLWQENYEACIGMCNNIINSNQYRLIPVFREEKRVVDMISGQDLGFVYIPLETDADNLYDELFVRGYSVESIFEFPFPVDDRVLADPFYPLFSNANRPALWAKTENLDYQIFPSNILDKGAYDIRSNSFSYRSGTKDVWKWIGKSRSEAIYRNLREFPNWILYRLADIYMMRAEAYNQLGIQESNQEYMALAYQDVKIIRDRANAVETTETTFADDEIIDGEKLERLILNERAREFAFEAKRWYDVLRFAKRNNYGINDKNRAYLMQMAIFSTTPEKLVSLQNKYKNNAFHYWPIHVNEVERNPSLTQNEFYLNFK